MDTAINQENPNQVTRSKAKLRHEIKELENVIVQMKNSPVQQRLTKVEAELVALKARYEEIETASVLLVKHALVLGRLIADDAEATQKK